MSLKSLKKLSFLEALFLTTSDMCPKITNYILFLGAHLLWLGRACLTAKPKKQKTISLCRTCFTAKSKSRKQSQTPKVEYVTHLGNLIRLWQAQVRCEWLRGRLCLRVYNYLMSCWYDQAWLRTSVDFDDMFSFTSLANQSPSAHLQGLTGKSRQIFLGY